MFSIKGGGGGGCEKIERHISHFHQPPLSLPVNNDQSLIYVLSLCQKKSLKLKASSQCKLLGKQLHTCIYKHPVLILFFVPPRDHIGWGGGGGTNKSTCLTWWAPFSSFPDGFFLRTNSLPFLHR